MKLSITIEVPDSAQDVEIGYVLRQAAQAAEYSIMRHGHLAVDEERDLKVFTSVIEVKESTIFRTE